MKALKTFLLIISLVALIVMAFLFLGRINPQGWAARLWSERSATSSRMVEMQYLAQLNTAEYRMELIFPYDFVEGTPDWGLYKNLWDFHPANFQEKIDPENYAQGELPQQWVDGPLYAQCRDIGVDPYNFRYDFLVFSVLVKAGIDLENPSSINLEWEGEGDSQRLSIEIPPAGITELRFIDQSSRDRGYPDAPISPQELRSLVELLTPLIEERALEAGILDEADRQARDIVEYLFQVSSQ